MAKTQKKQVKQPASKLTKVEQEMNDRAIRCITKIQKALQQENCTVNIRPVQVPAGQMPQFNFEVIALPNKSK